MLHLASSVFDQSSALPSRPEPRSAAGPASTLSFGDGLAEPLRPLGIPKTRSIFGEASDETVTFKPSIAMVGPDRNQSCIFSTESAAVFQPTVRVTDQSRFASSIFAEGGGDVIRASSELRPPSAQLQSQILGGDGVGGQQAGADDPAAKLAPRRPINGTIAGTKSSCPFSTDDEQPSQSSAQPHGLKGLPPHMMDHFQGTSFALREEEQPTSAHRSTFSGFQCDGRTNRGTFSFAPDAEEETPRSVAINPRAATANQSTLSFGDAPEGEPAVFRPSSRVSQPPGGHSTIFLG